MNFLSLIEAKREGKPLSPGDIKEFVTLYTDKKIPDYQMSAMLMAIYFRGLTTPETSALTMAMRDSGDILEFPEDPRPIVDKHSTGGVGDKVSFPLAPLLACLGFRVPMISGRGLGITGGTLDKLESIPGFKTKLDADRAIAQVQKVGCVICGQTGKIAPADKRLYALRDVTGTVPSIPLIVASIMSKKLAEGLGALVLDVKCGSAAFMKTEPEARELATAMVALGNSCGVKTRAVITDMNAPIGRSAGNWLEIKESIDCLEGKKPTDLRTIVIECAAQLLEMTDRTHDIAAARKMAEECLDSGAPAKKFDEMLRAQGANIESFNERLHLKATAKAVVEMKAKRSGFISKCDARIIGEAVRDLGGGRLTKESEINHDVGIDRMLKPGDAADAGQVLCRVHAADADAAKTALERLEVAFEIADEPLQMPPLILDVIAGPPATLNAVPA